MLPFIVIALIAARLCGYKLSVLKKGYALLPFLVVIFSYWTFQILVLNGHYEVIALTKAIQTGLLISMIPPILFYKIYIPSIIGAAFSITGSILNRVVITANGGLMPVRPSLSLLTGYYNEKALLEDGIHSIFSDTTVYKPLCDIIDTGFSIMSIGDVMIHTFFAIMIFFSVAYLNKNQRRVSDIQP